MRLRVGIPISNERNKSVGKYSFKTLFRVFLKTGKKRIVITAITGMIVFLLLTTFFMAWFNYRYASFYKFIDSRGKWTNDGWISIRTDEIRITTLESYGENYLELVTNEITNYLDSNIPGMFDKKTSSLHSVHYCFQFYPEVEILPTRLMCFDNQASNLYESCLKEGRLPTNSSELLYQPQNITHPKFGLNDRVELKPQYNIASTEQNFTIVGVLDNIGVAFYKAGYSVDILGAGQGYWYYGDEDDYLTLGIDSFFTYQDYYVEAMTNFINFYDDIILNIDYNYQFEIQHIRELNNIVSFLYGVMYEPPNFEYLPFYIDDLCFDLLWTISTFNNQWLFETVKVFASSVPVIFLFGLICFETLKIGTYEKESKFKLMKLHGLKFGTLKKMILLENIIIAGSSIITGFVAGTFIGYLFSLALGNKNFGIYLAALGEPLILTLLFTLFLLLFIGGFMIENSLAKKSVKLVSEQYKQKRKKLFRRILSTPEVILLLIGILVIAIGMTGLYFEPFIDYTMVGYNYMSILVTFLFLAALGALFLIISLFQLLTRLINLLWKFMGNKSWNNVKSFFTLSLKHLAIYTKNYQRTVLAMFIIGLGITPGLIANKSINNQIFLESNISVGCADILVSNYNPYDEDAFRNISKMEGVKAVTPVSTVHLDYYYWEWEAADIGLDIDWLVIYNVSEFNQIIDHEPLKDSNIDSEDILALEENMTYIMSKKYVKEEGYSKKNNFTTSILAETQNKVYTLEYIEAFDYFPLLTRSDYFFFNSRYDIFSIVTSNETFSQILNSTDKDIWIRNYNYLLIQTTETANITKIREDIAIGFGLPTKTSEDVAEDLERNISVFEKNFLVLVTIVTILATMFFGIITAQNIYYQRLRIIESEYQIGAKRYQIWGSFTIELVFIVLLPILISMAITVPILYVAGGVLLNLEQTYVRFKPWLPWWIIISIILFTLVILVSSWLLEIIILVRKYRPIKQE